MKAMKFMFGLLLCVGIGLVLTSCKKDEDKSSLLEGTWSESNALYSVTLALNEDGSFDFKVTIVSGQGASIPTKFNGRGTYKYAQDFNSEYNVMKEKVTTNMHLVLTYTSKSMTHTFEIMKLSSSQLDLEDRYGQKFKLTK